MLRSMLTAALATLALVACATSQSSPTTTAPVVSASASVEPVVATPAPVVASASAAPAASEAAQPAPGDGSTGVGAQFRACTADTDCIAVPRASCCDNGWKEAVAASQKDAYAQANACTRRRPICPMYRVRDRRVPYCDPQAHLCTMKQP